MQPTALWSISSPWAWASPEARPTRRTPASARRIILLSRWTRPRSPRRLFAHEREDDALPGRALEPEHRAEVRDHRGLAREHPHAARLDAARGQLDPPGTGAAALHDGGLDPVLARAAFGDLQRPAGTGIGGGAAVH